MGVGVLAGAALLALARWDVSHDFRKVAGALLTPVGLTWLLLGGLTGILWRRSQRGLAAVAGAGWLLLSLAGNPQLAARQFALLEGPFATAAQADGVTMDALLVLGGGVMITSTGRVTLGDAAERVTWPVQLYRQGVARSLVSSGPSIPSGRTAARTSPAPPPISYAEAVAAQWIALGVASQDIVVFAGPRTTKEEINAFRRLVEERGWRRVGVATSAWHMRRALRHCRRVGLDVHPFPCDVRGDPPHWRWRHLLPSASALAATSVAWTEALALLAGR